MYFQVKFLQNQKLLTVTTVSKISYCYSYKLASLLLTQTGFESSEKELSSSFTNQEAYLH